MMFNKKSDAGCSEASTSELGPRFGLSSARTIPQSGLPSRALIDSSLNIIGNLETDGDVQVAGQIDGNVSCAHLTVEKDGTINGDIIAQEVVVRGSVKGAIRASRVMLLDSANVAGDIAYCKMSMEEGATFVGVSSKRTDDVTTTQVATLQHAATEMCAPHS